MDALQINDRLADASAEQAKQRAPEDYSARDWGAILSPLLRAQGRPNTETDCSPNQNRTCAPMIHPRCLVASTGISTLSRKWPRRSASLKLRHGCVALVG